MQTPSRRLKHFLRNILVVDDEAIRHWNNIIERLIRKCKDSQARQEDRIVIEIR